jgi:iron(II)-dependent oxidoreductase
MSRSDLLIAWARDARRRTLELIDDLTDAQLLGPHLATVNPPLWEIGHLAWFQEKWLLRRGGEPSLRADADALYDSSAVAHETRWGLPLPSRRETLAYMRQVLDRVIEKLGRGPVSEDAYFSQLATFHEDMHGEAFAYTCQTLGYPRPSLAGAGQGTAKEAGPLPGDVAVPGGRFLLGARPGAEPFVFDNEQWAHPVELRPFAIARAPVTQAEFAAFVEEDGYRHRELWDEAGWAWREGAGALHPVYWRREGPGRWLRRDFEQWVPLEPHRPVLHVNWYEAQAYCRWAGRRLPTEAEWEAAAGGPERRFPWGDGPPSPERANLDGLALGCVDVAACPSGDSPHGCRQMIGNVWEWTDDDFLPYPGFEAGPYREYSEPWFGTHKVLRGGCWVTRARLLRNTWRNFYKPDRRDVWAGFRTCAVQP